MIFDKTKLAVALLSILGLVIGTCVGTGVLRIPQPRLAFDLMMLLTFVWMLIWTIRKRHANEKDQQRELDKVEEGQKINRRGRSLVV